MSRGWTALPREWVETFGEIAKFCGKIVAVGCYYGYNAGGGPVGVGTVLGTQLFWGANPRAPIGG